MLKDDITWNQRAFESTKAALELAELELKAVTDRVRQLISDLQSVCAHQNIKEDELKDYYDNGYGQWRSKFNYSCFDCKKRDEGQDSVLGKLYYSGNKVQNSCNQVH